MDCWKCNGSGKYLNYGVCFRCGGTGKNNALRGKQNFQVGDKIKKKSQRTIFEIVKVTPKHYLTACNTKLGRHIDKYPEESPEAYEKIQ